MRSTFLALATALSVLGAARVACGATQTGLATRVPAEAAIFVELRSAPDLIESAEAVLRAVAERLPMKHRALVRMLPALATGALGMPLDELAAVLASRDAAFALVFAGGGGGPKAVLLSRIDDEADVRRTLTRLDAKGAWDVRDGLLVVSDSKRTVDGYWRWYESGRETLAERPDFAAGRPELTGGAMRAFVDLAALRTVQNEGEHYWDRLDAAGRFLVGPVSWLFDAGDRLDAALKLADSRLSIEATIDASPLSDAGLAPMFAGRAAGYPTPAKPADAFAHLVLDRSLAGFWKNLDRLVSEDDVVGAKSFLSIADTLLVGSFVDDLLPSIGEPMHVFAIRMPAPEDGPKIELPALVLVAGVGDRKLEGLLGRLFSNLMTIQQQERTRDGLLPFRARRRRSPDGQPMWIAEPTDWRGPGRPPLAAGFSPTLSFYQGHVIIGTTEGGVRAMHRALDEAGGDRLAGDALRIDPEGVGDYLERNLDALVIDNVLNEGKTVAKARSDLEIAIGVLNALSVFELRIEPGAEATTGRLNVELRR